MKVNLRSARPEDHDWIVAVVDDWWGRPVTSAVPRLFLDLFHRTSLVAEIDGEQVGFLIGFCSPSQDDCAYIHFVAVDPAHRGHSIGRLLYEEFLHLVRSEGHRIVSAVTAAVNVDSIAFHQQMGFAVSDPIDDYYRPGATHVLFSKQLDG